jgi:hypothetical protein
MRTWRRRAPDAVLFLVSTLYQGLVPAVVLNLVSILSYVVVLLILAMGWSGDLCVVLCGVGAFARYVSRLCMVLLVLY